MGGKSRKSGGVSRTLINRIKREGKRGSSCGKPKEVKKRKGLLDHLGDSEDVVDESPSSDED